MPLASSAVQVMSVYHVTGYVMGTMTVMMEGMNLQPTVVSDCIVCVQYVMFDMTTPFQVFLKE